MRRPQPLPTPPRREPDPTPAVEVEPARAEKQPSLRERLLGDRGVLSPDEVETDLDVPTLDAWARESDVEPPARPSRRGDDVDPDAETDVIDDHGVFVRDDDADEVLAPVLPISPAEPATRPKKLAKRAPKESVDAPAAEDAEITGFGDVWRASRAHRKALRREVRRFTVRSRRRRLAWIISLSAVLAVVVGSFAVAYSPLFAVEKITVAGASMIDPAAVQASLAGELGSPLAAIDRAAIKKQLETFPAVETYSLEARPPHELVVRLVERSPVGVVTTAAGYDLVDAAGVTLSTSAEPPVGQPVISATGGTDSAAFRAIGRIIRSVPDGVRTQLAAVSATTAYDVSLTLAGTGTTIVWGSAEDSAQKALVLEKIMGPRPPDTVSVYDVSSPSNVIVR